MKLLKRVLNAALLAMLFSAGVANAALLQFTVSGDYTASWQMDANPVPDDMFLGAYFAVWDVEGFPDAVYDVANVYFYGNAAGGGVGIYDFNGGVSLLGTNGPQLFNGTEDNPFFILGSFALTEFNGTGNYRLTIAEVGGPVVPPGNVPEPSTGALLLGGAAIMAGVCKRRNRLVA